MTDLFYASGTCSASAIPTLTAELTRSLRRPGRKTLRLIDKALSYLTPYENYVTNTARSANTPYCEADTLRAIDTARSANTPYCEADTLRAIDTARSANTPYCEADTLKKDLLTLLTTHRMVLMPYIDTDRIETNLLHS
ncbi:MAG: hypothetical protein K2N25_05105 [Muribaculaceae bacterium]|nr:hypothetical protein [Muribaculaceae bacterium]